LFAFSFIVEVSRQSHELLIFTDFSAWYFDERSRRFVISAGHHFTVTDTNIFYISFVTSCSRIFTTVASRPSASLLLSADIFG